MHLLHYTKDHITQLMMKSRGQEVPCVPTDAGALRAN